MAEHLETIVRDQHGKKSAKDYRRNGQVPGIIYSGGEDTTSILFDSKELFNFLSHGHGLIDLKIKGEKAARKCVLQAVQFDPVTEDILHIDFLGVKMGTRLQVNVQISLVGVAEGTKVGGMIQQPVRELHIECLPIDIPDHLEVDITHVNIGDHIQVKELSFDKIEILNDPNDTVVTCELPKIVEVVEEEEEVDLEGAEVSEDGEDSEDDS